MTARPVVYIVDHDPYFRRSLAHIMRAKGIDTRAFATAADVIDAIDYLAPGCFLIDLAIQDGGGLELIRMLAAARPEMSLILMAQDATVRIAVQAVRAGALDVLERPFDDADMLMLVWQALGDLRERVREVGRAQDARSRIALLTARERDVLGGIIAGQPNRAVAERLGIGIRTVEMHRANLMRKLGVLSVPELTRVAALAGFRVSADWPEPPR